MPIVLSSLPAFSRRLFAKLSPVCNKTKVKTEYSRYNLKSNASRTATSSFRETKSRPSIQRRNFVSWDPSHETRFIVIL